jgi:addiction module HigA family antidote
MAKKKIVSPADALAKALADFGLTPETLAAALGEKPAAIKNVTSGRKGIAVPLGLKLAKVFGTADAYWLDVQTAKGASRRFEITN